MAVLRLRNLHHTSAAVWPLGCSFSEKVPPAQKHYDANLRDMLSILDRPSCLKRIFWRCLFLLSQKVAGDCG